MDRRAAKGAVPRQLALSGRIVEYSFARGRRRTLGITVDANGLAVAAPLRMPWREIEAFLRGKERWISHAVARDRGFPARQGALDRRQARRVVPRPPSVRAARGERRVDAALRQAGSPRGARGRASSEMASRPIDRSCSALARDRYAHPLAEGKGARSAETKDR